MAKSVGLEIHARGVRAVEVTGKGKRVKVLRYAEHVLTPRGSAPDPDELRQALHEIFRGAGFNRNHVIACVDAHDTVVREIPVPFKSEDQISKVVKYEAEHHLHDCDADDVIVQYTRVGESLDGTNLLVFASRKDDISRRVEYCRDAGVEPLAMDLDALAVFNTVSASGQIEATPHCVILNIGHRSTEMIFVVDGSVRALRSVRIGVDSIAHGLARDMDIGFSEADSKLVEITEAVDSGDDLFIPSGESDKRETEKSHTELEHDLFAQKRDEFLARLKREFVRSSAALHGADEVEVILVTGPGLAVPGLLPLLGQRLGITVESFHPSQAFTCKLNGTTPEAFDAGAVVALGLALKGAGTDPIGLDFRQEELKVANKFELMKNALAVTVTLLFIGLLLFSFSSVIRKRQLRADRFEPTLTNAYQAFSEVAQKYNGLSEAHVASREHVVPNDIEGRGERYLAIKRFVGELRTMRRRLHRKMGTKTGLEEITSALKMWNDVFGVIKANHEEIQYVDFEGLDIRQQSVTLTMIVPSAAAADRLNDAFKKLAVLKGWEADPIGIVPLRNTNHMRTVFRYQKSKRGRRR